jgi:hypothetical protein
MSDKNSIVVTSIFEPNDALKSLARGAVKNHWEFIIVGDTKSPPDFNLPGSTFYDVETQINLGYKFSALCPTRHYSRKNIGYLIAIKNRSTSIIETDDDNIPREDFWVPRQGVVPAIEVKGEGWFNVYSLYSDKTIWPRGLPLENVLQKQTFEIASTPLPKVSPIQQGLADENPDVDAVFRLTYPLPVNFNKLPFSVSLNPGVWCPFNSQNTTWFKDAFPLLYLPSYCTFRMTDIWRSFVAQRIAWECGWEITFHNATVYQERNDHNLLRDFELEIPGYMGNNKIKDVLENISLRAGKDHIAHNLVECYTVLIKEKFITDNEELTLLHAWLSDLQKII